jgi:hypothetical protein
MMHSVRVGKLAVTGFRYPDHRMPAGQDDNVVRPNEVRVASHSIAVLAPPSFSDYIWTCEDAAQHTAALLSQHTTSKVLVTSFERKEDSMKAKASKGQSKGGSKKGKARAARKGPQRQCSVCQEKGHTARSHQPGGRLA